MLALALSARAADAPKTYRNPLLPEVQVADPDVLKVDGRYYLYATTHTKGFETYISDDLVHWTNGGIVFHDPRGGDWAPGMLHSHKDNKFYLYYTDNIPGMERGGLNKQIGVAMADSPRGPFVDKAVLASVAIDAQPFEDEDGKLYLYYVDLVGGFKIKVQPMSDPLTMKGKAKVLIHPTEAWEKSNGEVTEGPYVIKHNGLYYLMFSGTGADSPNYGLGYATSKSPMGPFKKYAGNPFVHRTDKIFGPGHHCVVEGSDKKLWLVYHQKWNDDKGWHRFLAIDPMWFDDKGVIHAKVSRDTDEPAP